jgi:hypothetical protein
MELLTRTFRGVRRLLSPNAWFTLGVGVGVLTIELGGRQAPNDIYDAAAASFLGLLIAIIVYRHRSSPLPWVSRVSAIGQRLYSMGRLCTFEFGIDLRGGPPIRGGYPPSVLIGGLLLMAWGAVVLFLGHDFPHVMRLYGLRTIYVGYLVALAALWALLLAAILLAGFIPLAMIHDAFVGRYVGSERRSRQKEMFAIFAFPCALVMIGYALPGWLLLAVCALVLATHAATVVVPANAHVQFLWRPRDSVKVRAIRWPRWVQGEFVLVTVLLVDLMLTANGGRLLTGQLDRGPMPVTAMLGAILAVFAPGLLLAMVYQTVVGRWRDPARKCPPTVHIHGTMSVDEVREIRRAFHDRGWRVTVEPMTADAAAVEIEIVQPERSEATEFDPEWPLKVCLADLQSDAIFTRLMRRREIGLRRRMIAGLEKMFKRAARRKYEQGHGFWVAPHYWFITGLSRDLPEEELDLSEAAILSGTIGPTYHRVLSHAGRHYLYNMFRALQVDMIFVEDGVGFRRFRRVLRRLFEIYDRHDGRRRAEDANFTGIPGTRVLIHEFQLDEPFKSELYPEPKFDYLGRARLLHVFRDRGEQEELIEPPFDTSRTPAPATMG